MKKAFLLLTFTFVLIACGGTQKVVSTTNSSEISETVNIAVDSTGNTIIVKEETEVDTVEEETEILVEESIDEEIEVITETINTTEVFNHSVWNSLLIDNVSLNGNVNYEGFRQNKGQLRDYIASLGTNMPAENWTQEDKLAYWMNAYNAMTVDLILRNLPLKSIKDIDKPWNQRLWKLGAKWYNLDEIEHQILRKMNDPRIHFGINCASFSCPPLLNEAFTSATVDTQLESLAKRFINDPQRNSISANKIQLSKVFSWFGKDFKKNGSLIDYLNKYADVAISNKAKKSYKEYNWNLNN